MIFLLSCSKEHYLTDIKEIDPKLFIDSKGAIYFSFKSVDRYQISTWQNQSISVVIQSDRDQFYPFCYKGEICALYDNEGNENWRTTNATLNAQLQHHILKRIKSDKTGRLIVFQLKNSNELLLLDAESGIIQKITDIAIRYHNTIIDGDNQRIFISLDDKIIEYDVAAKKAMAILPNLLGEKRNIFLYGDVLYFNSNDTSEYHQIYKYSLINSNSEPILVHKGASDVMMPKIINGDLYFIQCFQSHYQLRRKSANRDDLITKTGVVYQYCAYKDGQILISYSDFDLPKSLMLYHIDENKLENLTGKRCPLDIKVEYQQQNNSLSPAYKIVPDNDKKGTILFFHPGLNSDFSPRWETILINLAQSGYEIVCPNYPMSFGYGKTYNTAQFRDAIRDMTIWKNQLLKENDNLPLFLLASSSGNLLMEAVLYLDNCDVDGAVSIFGLYNSRIPPAHVPQLVVLGSNDPRVDWIKRSSIISESTNKNIRVICLEDEGHWVRNNRNNKQILDTILSFLTE